MTISVSESLRFGWETFKKNPWMLVGGFVLVFLVSGISNGILAGLFPVEAPDATYMSSSMNFLLSFAVGIIVEMGLLTFVLRAHDSIESLSFSDLWNPQSFLSYLLAQIVVGIAVILGFVLLIVPGIIVALGLLFTPYIVLDQKKGPIEALKMSWAMTKGHRWRLFLLMCSIVLLNILGMLLLFVGLIVTAPVSMLALAHTYRLLSNSSTPISTA
jgi:uncharacterized membrane protein